MKFRPCIDLHNGVVKQIVGSTLTESTPQLLQTNFVAKESPAWFAALYKKDNLRGGHIIKLGGGNDQAAREALAAWPGGMQIGGGITAGNARMWLDQGASHVIVTSSVFKDGEVHWDALARLVKAVGRKRIVLDLSCRKRDGRYFIVTDRWQKFTNVEISAHALASFSKSCDEFLIHAADVEGKCGGIEEELVRQLAKWVTIPTTYAGGVRNIADLQMLDQLGGGRLDVTIGSALDIFGGTTITYREAVAYHNRGLKNTPQNDT